MDALLAALGVSAPLAPFSSGDAGSGALLAARAALLFAAFWGGRPRLLSAAAALFVGSLAATGFFVPFVVVAGLAAWPNKAARALAVGASVASIVVAVLVARVPRVAASSGDVAAETAEWIRRDNLFQAHASAARWASVEGRPGDGHLALARLDWELGHRAEAVDLAADAAENGDGARTKDRAASLLRAWSAR